MFVPINGPVVADTVYVDGKMVARDVSVTLPEVTPMTADLKAMGTYSMPIWSLLEHMETALTKIGVDMGLLSLIKPGVKTLEFRWVQTVTDANGNTKNVGCKAFIKGTPNKIPGVGLEVGAAIEGEVTIATTRYTLFVDGKEMFVIDRLTGDLIIDGENYANLNSLL